MSAAWLYAVGTLLTWTGWLLAAQAVVQIVRLVADRGRTGSQAWGPLAAGSAGAAAALVIGPMLARPATPPLGGALALPLAWIVMPFWAWATLACGVMAIARMAQIALALSAAERRARLGAAAVWAVVAGAAYWLLTKDADRKVLVVKGALPIPVGTAAAIVLLGLSAVAVMVVVARTGRARGIGKSMAAHAALLAGAVVFGLPFAYLLVTSFKEDRDMSSPDGIVWVPRVQQTVPYFDKKNPLYATRREGQEIEGTILERYPDGSVKVDVFKPFSIRGTTFVAPASTLREIPRQAPLVTASLGDTRIVGKVVEDFDDGRKRVEVVEPPSLAGKRQVYSPAEVEPVREIGLRWQNYTEALSFMPPETKGGLVYLKNTLLLVVLTVIGTLLSSSVAAYSFSRLRYPGRDVLFGILLATMMLPGAVTLLPQFLVFRNLGWVDTLYPLWVPAFFGSAFNIFLLRQFFMGIPMELEDAAKVDGCSYLRAFWSVMLPQIKPALAVVAIWTFMGAWNNFMGPLIYVNSPERMPLSYALQLFQSDRGLGEPGLLMAFTTLAMVPVIALFFFAQRYFIEGMTLSGLGGR